MWREPISCNVLLLAFVVTDLAQGVFLKERPWGLLKKAPFYHSSEAIHEQLMELSNNCSGASLTLESLSQAPSQIEGRSSAAVDLHVATISQEQSYSKPPLRALLLFGEHARELVSAESGLDFVRTMCGASGDEAQQTRAQDVLKGAELKVVVNANPTGRMQVEAGKWCHRANGRGVDLNRNWKDHFKEGKQIPDSWPGPEAFSESETRELRDLAKDWEPQLFLAVHSGTRLLAYPHGYATTSSDDEDQVESIYMPDQKEVLQPIASKYCPKCSIAPLGKSELGYSAAGTSMDYVFDKVHAHYSFLWEIYDGRGLERNKAFLSEGNDSGGADGHDSGGDCLQMFNPTSAIALANVVKTWTSAYMDLISAVAAKPRDNTNI